MLCLSSTRLFLNSSNDCTATDFTVVSLLVFWGVPVSLALDSALTRSELCGIDAVSFSLSQFSSDLSWENGWSLLILVDPGDLRVVRQGRFGVVLDVPYRLQRLMRWLRLWLIYTRSKFRQLLNTWDVQKLRRANIICRGAPDPEFLDPAGSGSGPDPETLDPSRSGSFRIRIQPDWVLGFALPYLFNCLRLCYRISVPRQTSKKVLVHNYQLSVLRETVFRVRKHLWGEARKATIKNSQKTSVYASQFEMLGVTFDFLWLNILRLAICLWHLLHLAERHWWTDDLFVTLTWLSN